MTREEVDAICAQLREAHAEFRAPLTWHGIQRVLRRMRVRYERVPLSAPAMLVTHAGVSVILLNSNLPARSHTEAMAHEFAHIQLHAGDPAELIFHVWRPGVTDLREREADYLSRCLMLGPGVELPFDTTPVAEPTPAPARVRERSRPFTQPFPDPYDHPARERDRSPLRRQPRYGGRFGETALQRALRLARPVARPMRDGPPSDAGIITYERKGPATRVRFVDEQGMRWTIHDIAFLPERTVIEPGRPVAKYRYFVNANGARRCYQFSRWERRDVAPRHCERQLRDATQVPARPPADLRQTAG